jgi:hypothetical protein
MELSEPASRQKFPGGTSRGRPGLGDLEEGILDSGEDDRLSRQLETRSEDNSSILKTRGEFVEEPRLADTGLSRYYNGCGTITGMVAGCEESIELPSPPDHPCLRPHVTSQSHPQDDPSVPIL